jgi:hypothetical protein
MKKLKLLLLALMATCGLSLNAANKVVGDRFTSLEDLDGKLFAVVDETSSIAMGFGVSGHGNSWDMYFGTYNEVYNSNACYLKIETASDGYCYLHTYNSTGNLYNISWASGGYFNSQKADQRCCFALGKDQDGANLSVWSIEVSEGKFALKNKGTGLYLHNDNLPAKYDDPFYFTFCTLIDDPLPAAQEKYTSLKDKYLAFNANLDVTEVEALYNSATTVAGVQTAIDALISTFGSSLANETSLTALISNPSFESGFTGWTNNGMATQNNNSFVGKEGSNYCEAWQPNGTKGVSQTLTLPQGAYSMSANSLARGVTSAKLYAGSKEKAITIADAANPYNLDFYVSKDGDVTIGFEGVGTGAGASWICVDNFQLTYVQNMTAEEFAAYEAHKEALEAYNNALAAAQAVVAIPSTASTNLQNAISDNTLADGSTTEQYNTAATALNAAATAAQSLVTPYAVYLDTKSAVVTMKDADTYTGADAKSTLEGVITTTSSNVEEATDASTITAQTDDLVEAAKDFVKSVTIKADQCLDLTCLIKNPHFKYGEGGSGKVADGWTLAAGGWVTEHRLQTHNFEAWHAYFDLSQTITDLPMGTYKVTLQGFARHDDSNVTDKTNLYCGIVNQKIKDINDEYSTTSLINGKPNMGDGNGESNTDGKYRPNGMSASYYFFQEVNSETSQPFYTNEVQTLIPSDGDLKIGFKCETNKDWVIWDNFHLYYYGSAIAVTIDEDAANSSYSEDIKNANITLNRTFSAGKWNTIALPFDLTDAETKAAFGDDVVVATYSETYTDDGLNDSKVTFDKADDASITANTPVLLKTSTDKTTFTFNGKTIMAGEAKVEGGANFDFVGTYAASTTIAKGDYFIRDNQLWQSKGETTIKGTRAYFKAKTEGAQSRIADLRIGESETTGIVSVDNGVKTIENATFDLQGRKVANVKKGLYIKNFKKVLVR